MFIGMIVASKKYAMLQKLDGLSSQLGLFLFIIELFQAFAMKFCACFYSAHPIIKPLETGILCLVSNGFMY
jgi:hypothetical protein